MDRSSRRPEPIEPNRSSDQSSSPGSPIERTTPEVVDSKPQREARTQQDAAGPGYRTAEERSTTAAESAKDAAGSRLHETQEDRPDHSSARPGRNAAESTDQRTRGDAARTETTQSSRDATSTVQDASDRLPADLREQMLQDPVFTRLGWGAGDAANSENEDDIRGRDPREQAVGPEEHDARGEPEIADVSEPATRNGEAAGLDSESRDGSPSAEEQPEGDSATGSQETAGTGPETPAVAAAPNRADAIAATPEDMILDSDARDDPKSTEPRSDIELVDQRSVDRPNTVADVGADKEQRHWLGAAVDTESAVQGAGDAAMPVGESLTTLPDGETVTESRKESETSLLTSNADASGGVQGGGGGNSGATIPPVRRLIENPPPHSESAPAKPSGTPDQSDTAHDRHQPQKVGEAPGDPIKLSTSNRTDRKALNNPAADSTIVVDERFTYRTDENRRVVRASAKLTVVDLDYPRNNYAQRTLAGKLPGDHAGHLFARIFQGPGQKLNLTPMEGMRVNKKEFDTMEKEWRHAIQQGKEVEVFVELDYPDEGPRPEYISVVYKMDGKSYTRDIKNTPMQRRDGSSA